MGPLTGDGREQAVVDTSCGYATSTSGFDEVFVFTMKGGVPTLLAKLQNLDRDMWPGIDVKIVNGFLIIEYLTGGSHASPAFAVTLKYHWDGNRFVQSGKTQRPFTGN